MSTLMPSILEHKLTKTGSMFKVCYSAKYVLQRHLHLDFFCCDIFVVVIILELKWEGKLRVFY